jgi:hypothetical protein
MSYYSDERGDCTCGLNGHFGDAKRVRANVLAHENAATFTPSCGS